MEEKTDVGLKHVAHEHLLILNQNFIAEEGEVCSACREQIHSCKSFVYTCGNITRTTSTSGVEQNCVEFLLHRTCAELARETVNPTNQNEFFTFFPIPKIYRNFDSSFYVFPCMLCFLPWEWFSYGRSSDNSFFCFKCAVLLFQQSRKDPKFEHPGHSHPLAFIEHPSSFKCYACKVNDNILDLSYRCTECQFLIHKSCGDAPASFQFQFHKHPLILSFSLPQVYHSFFQHCRLCNKTVSRIEWLYCCRNCRYFTHFQCARSSPMLSSNEDETYSHLVHLPAADELSLDVLLEQFIKDKITLSDSYNDYSISGATKYIKHWSHEEHDLKLITSIELYNWKNGDEILLVCDVCVKPIRTYDRLFYGCVPCKYFMHIVCAEFPREIEHHLWPGKKLTAKKNSEPFKLFKCNGCRTICSGIFFYGKRISLHIGCVTLPKIIKHEAHHHQLNQVSSKYECTACGFDLQQCKYRCEKCEFYVCARCIRYARTYKHRWDPHPLELIYDAGMVEEHEHEYECEYCSKEIDTNRWFYHCSKCDLSIHPGCIEKLSYGSYKCVKFGATDINRGKLHPHKLTYVLNKKVRRCDKCGEQSLGQPVLQCAPCNTIFCCWCW